MKKRFYCIFSLISFCSYAQQGSFSYVDPAQAFNRVSNEANSHKYFQISNYKVVGTPFLYGENVKGELYGKDLSVKDAVIKYNVYTQKIEYVSDEKIIEVTNSIDSFVLNHNPLHPVKFKASKFITGVNDKYYFQEILEGQKFSLYKKYTMELGVVSTNYVQSELRQFDLQYEYYYKDHNNGEVRKIKPGIRHAIKEFKDVVDLKAVFREELQGNPEEQLIQVFAYLNR